MKNKVLRKDMLFLFASLAVLIITLIVLFVLGKRSYGHISVYAADAYSLRPLENAIVILPECGMQAETDEQGKAAFYNVPVKKNQAFEEMAKQNFGQTTVLCFKKGYQPYALFYAQLQQNRVRESLTLYMFPEGTEAGCVIEAPPEEWINRLFDIYDPF